MTLDVESIPAPARTLSVLVVEDEARWRDFLVDVIPDMGFVARGVGSAEQALDVMASEPHDILMLDLHLPALTGIELFEIVRTRWPETEGIILTAYGELSAAQKAIRLRVVEFLTKPCHLYEIEGALERARRLIVATQSSQNVADVGADRVVTLEAAERERIREAMARNHNNKSAAARELGISRRSLYDRLNQMR